MAGGVASSLVLVSDGLCKIRAAFVTPNAVRFRRVRDQFVTNGGPANPYDPGR
jgi:hypothetical protein